MASDVPQALQQLKQWWTYLSQFRLPAYHIQGMKKDIADYVSRNNFDALFGERSDALAIEVFQRIDVELELWMHTAGVLEGWSLKDYQSAMAYRHA